MYGDQAVTIEDSDDLNYTEPEKSMQLLGCFPRSNLYPNRGTSLIRNIPTIGPYSSPMPRDKWWS